MPQGHFLIAAYVFAAGVTGVVAWRTYRHRHVPGARPFGIAMAGVSAWALLGATEQTVTGVGPVVYTLLYSLEWIPINVIAIGWLWFGLAYTGREEYVTRKRIAMLSIVPAAVLFVAFSHSYLIPVYADLLGPFAPLTDLLWAAENLYAEFGFIGTGYAYLLLATGSLFLFEVLFERPTPNLGQALLLLVVGPPWVLNLLHLTNVLRFRSFDPTVLGFTITGIAGLFAVGRFRLFDVPMARARVVDEIESGIVVYGHNGRVYDYNDRAASLLDLSPDVLGTDVGTVLAESPLDVDLPFEDFRSDETPVRTGNVPPGIDLDGEEGDREVETVVDGGATTLEAHLDGTTVPVEGSEDPAYVETRLSDLTNASGEPVSRVLLLYDVTGRERRERELQDLTTRFELALEATDTGVWEWNVETDEVFWDEATERLFGFGPGEFPGTYEAFVDRVHPEDLPDVERRIEAAIEGDGEYSADFRIVLPDGTQRWIHARGVVEYDGGQATRMFGVQTDVTERKERERELAQSRDRYRTLFENNQVILWELDLSAGKEYVEELAERTDDVVAYLEEHPEEYERAFERVEVLDVNRKAVEFYGATSKEDLLENMDELMTEKALEMWRELWGRVVEGERTFRTECVTDTFDGGTRTILVEVNVPETYAEDYSRVYMTAVDITERRERERELERKNEFLDEFASVVSHDVATPLGVIENKANLIEMTGDPGHVEDIYEATERVQSLIDQLRELARQGEQVGETAPLDLEAVTHEAWRSIDSAGATLSVVASKTIEADPDRFRQLLENLLHNAVEHGSTPEGPTRIEVGTLPRGFYVADDGPGIPAEEREAVFEQGFTTGEDNTGLGLAIVRRVVEGHGWDVEVTESEEGGARFEIRTKS